MPTKRKRAPSLPPPPSDEAACLTLLVRSADGAIAATHATPDAPPFTVNVGQTLVQAFPNVARLRLLVERTASTGKVITIMLPLPTATSPLFRCTGTLVPGDDAPEHVLLAITPTPAGSFGALAPPEDSVTDWRVNDAIKDEFMSVASHELRAPLQPLLLASRFIQRWIDRPERHDDLIGLADEIARQSKRMASLVQDMYDMTRINSGVFIIEPAPCDIAAIVRDVAEEQHSISQRDVVVVGADVPLSITADSERIWQALTNLISNAIKYSAAPAPVTVTMAPFASDGASWVRISVADRGIGIPADHIARLFERFYRASVTHQMAPQQNDGLGLGLYITQAIIAAHHGHLTVTSEVDVGSTFTVELPVG